ncbi:Importin-5 [Balamuthia mandrillaris]
MELLLAQRAIHEFNSQVAGAWAKGRLQNGSPEMEGMLSAVAWLIKNMQWHWKGLAAKERDALRDGVCQALELATCMSVLRTEEQAKEEEELLPAPQKGTERKVQAKVWNELNTFTLDDALKKATDETEREIWQFAIAVCFLDYLCGIQCQNSKLHRLLLGEDPANLFATKSPRMLLQLQAQADRMFSMMVLSWYDQTYAKCLLLNNDLRQAIAARVEGMLQTQQDNDYIRSCGARLRKWAAPEVRQLRGLEVGVQLSRYYELDNEQLSQTVHDILALCIKFTRDFVLTKDSILVEHFLVLLRAWDKLENMDHMGDAIGKLIQCIFLCSTHHSVPKGIRCVALDLLVNWYKKYPSIFHKSYNNTALQTLKSFAGPHDPDISIDEALTKQAFKARARYLRKPLVLVEGIMFSVLMMVSDLPNDPSWALRCTEDEDLSDYNAATEFLGHITSDVPPANDLIFALLPTLLSSQRWQMRWTAWIIVRGAASNLDHSQFKAIISLSASQMREESVNDTEPRVRWVMCAALGQLCAKLPYFVKDDWSQKAAILAHDLIVHDTSANGLARQKSTRGTETISMIVKRFVQAATKAINVTRDYGLVSTVAIGLRLVIPKQHFDDLFARPCFELCQAILTYIGKEWDKVRKTARTAQEQKQQISDEVAPLVSQFVELCKHCKDCSEGFFAFLDDLHSPYPLFLQLIVAQVDVTPVAHWSLHVEPFFTHVSAQPRPTIPTLRALAARENLRQAQQTPTTASSPRLPEDLRDYLEIHHRCGLCRRPYLEAVLVGRGAAPSTAKWKQHALCRPFWALCSFDCLAEARSWSSTTSKIIGLDTEKTCKVLLHALLSE